MRRFSPPCSPPTSCFICSGESDKQRHIISHKLLVQLHDIISMHFAQTFSATSRQVTNIHSFNSTLKLDPNVSLQIPTPQHLLVQFKSTFAKFPSQAYPESHLQHPLRLLHDLHGNIDILRLHHLHHRPSTKTWFVTHINFKKYTNVNSGMYSVNIRLQILNK